jgi:hypothetical protein
MTLLSLFQSLRPHRRLILFAATGCTMGLLFLLTQIKLTFEGDLEGIYLLRGQGGKLLEVRDDIYLGEAERLISKLEFKGLHDHLTTTDEHHSTPHLRYKWNSRGGHGYLHTTNPDGTEFIICLSRFLDSNGKIPRGLFIGGELPQPIYGTDGVRLNETGMASKLGGRWFHIWCNANEGIAGAASPTHMIYPSEWDFLGSKVLFSSKREIVLKSSHRTSLDGVPASIDRFLFYRAGAKHVILAIRVKNIGKQPTGFFYVYGDEPWLGDYGTSKGNVGWTDGKLYHYAGIVDPIAHATAGMADLGNPQSPYEQGRAFSGLANFISWIGMMRPTVVYFSNREGDPHDESERIPLDSPNNRVMFCQWGPSALAPQQSATILLAIGMADRNPATGLPMQPRLNMDWDEINMFMEGR